MTCQQDLHVIHHHIIRAQNVYFHLDWVYTIFTFFSTRGIASSPFSSLPPSLSLSLPPYPPSFFLFFFSFSFLFLNRGGKGVRTAAKNFLVRFQSILSRISQNVKCNIPFGDSAGIVSDVWGNWEIRTSSVPLSAVMDPVDHSWSSSPGSWMCDLSWQPALLPSCSCRKEVLCDVPSTQAPAHDLPQKQPLVPLSLKEFRVIQLRFFLTVNLL